MDYGCRCLNVTVQCSDAAGLTAAQACSRSTDNCD